MTDEKVKEAVEPIDAAQTGGWNASLRGLCGDLRKRDLPETASMLEDMFSRLQILQAERDKLSGEVERLTTSADAAEARYARLLSNAEAKLTALVELIEREAECFLVCDACGHQTDEIMKQTDFWHFFQKDFQALAHHSAPVGCPHHGFAPDPCCPQCPAPPSTPTSAPVEDVGAVEKIARIIDPEAWAEHDAQKAETAPYRGPIRLVAARVVEGSLAKAEAILAARSPSLVQTEPVAWRYETPTGVYPARGRAGGWVWQVSETLPDMPEGWARNLTPLYTRPESPALIQPQGEERS